PRRFHPTSSRRWPRFPGQRATLRVMGRQWRHAPSRVRRFRFHEPWSCSFFSAGCVGSFFQRARESALSRAGSIAAHNRGGRLLVRHLACALVLQPKRAARCVPLKYCGDWGALAGICAAGGTAALSGDCLKAARQLLPYLLSGLLRRTPSTSAILTRSASERA